MPCAPLDMLIEAAGLPAKRITFLSLDVEGAELLVLRSCAGSPCARRFRCVMVETVEDVSAKATIHAVHRELLDGGLKQSGLHVPFNAVYRATNETDAPAMEPLVDAMWYYRGRAAVHADETKLLDLVPFVPFA